MERYWLSSRRMTFGVVVSGGKVIDVAPIARKFIGQPFVNLVFWMQRQGGFRSVKMKE